MHIVVTLNARYIDPLCVMLRSLLDAHPGRRMMVHVIHTELAPEDFGFIRRMLDDERLELDDVRVEKEFLSDLPVTFHFSREMYYRLFAARLLDEHIDRVLYLDPDMVILAPLDELYDMEMGDAFFAAARSINPLSERMFKRRLRMPKAARYVNSGVLLMNLAALRREQDERAVFELIERDRNRLVLPDQDILNALYHDRIVSLDPVRYNFDARYYGILHALAPGRVSLERLPGRTCVFHYCGKKKPWHGHYRRAAGVFYRMKHLDVFHKPVE